MTYTFKDVEKITEELYNFAEGNYMLWIKAAWLLIEENKLNICISYIDHIRFYSLIYGLLKIYSTFSDKISDTDFDEDPYLVVDFGNLCDCDDEDEMEIVYNYINSLIHDNNNIYVAFDLLKKKLSVTNVFSALYYSTFYSKYSLEPHENDEFYYGDIENEEDMEKAIDDNQDYERRKFFSSCKNVYIYDDILGDLNISKQVAFDWLSEYM